jgi:catechol 2,3-dioxygenase-like lactoylglutathione lyase family enzyme
MACQIIDHVGINITDLDRSAKWYRRVPGFEIVHKWKTTWMIKREGCDSGYSGVQDLRLVAEGKFSGG